MTEQIQHAEASAVCKRLADHHLSFEDVSREGFVFILHMLAMFAGRREWIPGLRSYSFYPSLRGPSAGNSAFAGSACELEVRVSESLKMARQFCSCCFTSRHHLK